MYSFFISDMSSQAQEKFGFNVFLVIIGIVLANNIPYSNEFAPDDDILTEGSTYAMGKLTPDAFSILEIPETTNGNRLTIKEYSFFGMIPF